MIIVTVGNWYMYTAHLNSFLIQSINGLHKTVGKFILYTFVGLENNGIL